jgi:hypothetical protein
MIDEADSASNHSAFLDFLSQLRVLYLSRKRYPVFQSVILADVYDIKNLKQKIRTDGEHRYNSPWNIAADFNVDMNFSTVFCRTGAPPAGRGAVSSWRLPAAVLKY